MASNYLTALIHMVETAYRTLGLSRDEALRAFWPLVKGTLSNIETRGVVGALTGPIARGDAGTIEKHLRVFRADLPDLLEPYCALGLITVGIALEKKTLSPDRAESIQKLLKGGLRDEHAGKAE